MRLPLDLPVTIYLVSSGPSYYVERLAKHFNIPIENVLCSKYEFGPNGRLSRCNAVSQYTKVGFVDRYKNDHVLTIGIGDSVTQDGPFISACDIPILTGKNEGYLYAGTLQLVPSMIRKLSERISVIPRTKPAVFIGSASEQSELATTLQHLLSESCDAIVWNQGNFAPSEATIETLERALLKYDFAVFFVDPNDITISRGEEFKTARDNVILELGMFIGRLGRTRCFIVSPSQKRLKLPSDLLGVTKLTYDKKSIEEAPKDMVFQRSIAALARASQAIKHEVSTSGCIQSYL